MADVTHPQLDFINFPSPDAKVHGDEVHLSETHRAVEQEADQRKARSESSASESELQHALEVCKSYRTNRGRS